MRDTAVIEMRGEIKDRLCYMFLVFIAGCIIGWIYEEVFYLITEGAVQNRGILYGPWLPIYGAGALGIYAVKPLKKDPVMLFMLCTAISGFVEYVIGYVGVYILDMRLWDYRGLFLNLDGIICLRSVMSFGIMGMIFLYLLEPAAEKIYKKTASYKIQLCCMFILTVFIFDCIMSALFRSPITY